MFPYVYVLDAKNIAAVDAFDGRKVHATAGRQRARRVVARGSSLHNGDCRFRHAVVVRRLVVGRAVRTATVFASDVEVIEDVATGVGAVRSGKVHKN